MPSTSCATCGRAVGTGGCPTCAVALSGAAAAATAVASSRRRLEPEPEPPPRRRLKKGGVRATDIYLGREVIGQYVIREKLGQGGMGAVYLADQITVKRPAVIKVLHPQLSHDADVAARFAVEAQAASQINHPNSVTIYNYGTMEDGTLFLAMEYLAGKTLHEILADEAPLEPGRAVRIAMQVADALGDAHRLGMIHRDVKPSNVMLVARGRVRDLVKVLDFGIAKLEGTRMTQTGAVCGTPQYMSPEQLRGQELDGRSDLYSLGVVIFEMLTGRLPFQAANSAGYMFAHVTQPPPRLREVAPKLKVPDALEELVLRALAKDPAERPATMDEFAVQLGVALPSAHELSGISLSLPAAPPTAQLEAPSTPTPGAAPVAAAGAALAGGARRLAAGVARLGAGVLRRGRAATHALAPAPRPAPPPPSPLARLGTAVRGLFRRRREPTRRERLAARLAAAWRAVAAQDARRRLRLIVAAIALVAVAAGVLVAVSLGDDDARTPAAATDGEAAADDAADGDGERDDERDGDRTRKKRRTTRGSMHFR